MPDKSIMQEALARLRKEVRGVNGKQLGTPVSITIVAGAEKADEEEDDADEGAEPELPGFLKKE